MAILDRKVKSGSREAAGHQQSDQPFAEIDAKQLSRARRDPRVKQLLAAADRHMETLRAEGRID